MTDDEVLALVLEAAGEHSDGVRFADRVTEVRRR